MAETRVNRRKVRIGVVVSDKMDKTVVVRVTREFRHPVYGKRVKLSKKYMAHDENNQCQVGDVVKIMETRPLSRHKRWRVVEIIEKAKKLGEEAPQEAE
ncbi:MAG: 30S ribosomal protein S17 [Desulfurobacteriaceae bacterium]